MTNKDKIIISPKSIIGFISDIRSEQNATIVVTHYQRLLNYIVPDFVHVLVDGKIINSGDKNLALELEEKGYDKIIEEAKAK